MASSGQESERLNAQLLVDSIPSLIHTARPDGYLDYFNKPWLEYFGVTLDKVAGWNWTAFVHPEDVEGIVAKWRACLATGEVFEYETRVRSANGEYRWMFHRKVPLRDANGNIVKWYGSSIDIEERKAAEEKIREQETELRKLLNLMPQHVFVFAPDGSPIYANQGALEYFGVDADQLLAESRIKFVHPDDHEHFLAERKKGLLTGTPHEFEARLLRHDGTFRWFLSRRNPLKDERGYLLRWYGTATDIEDRKRAEEALRTSEAYLAEAQRLSQTGSWVWRVEGRDAIHLSDEWYRIYGFDPAEGIPTWEDRLQRIHPEDRAKWHGAIDQAIAERSDYEVEFRILLPDGSVKHVHTVGHPVLNASGDLVHFVGSSTDITERKQAEDKIRQSEMELRQMLDFTPQLVAVFGPNRERLYVNRIALDYLGTTLDEWRQKRTGAEIHPEDSERLKAYVDRASSSGSGFELELRVRKGDGSYRWFLARYNPLRDEKGQITRWYAACTDIEDRKQAEERIQNENVALREEIDKASMFEEIIGTSPALQAVISRVSKVAPTDSTVLITGETGTGKELVARAIHRRSQRSSRAFVSVNCAAIPRDLIASELFGHEKGAFTGATQQRLGRFELAGGGTIFLDEVGELTPETQIALLRVLQEHEFERVGGTRSIQTDVRVIAATNRDLQAAIAGGAFRSDLFYRLNVFPIEIPPLRERREDIPMMVEYFIDRYARKAGKIIRSVHKKTLDLLRSYPWPGNIRELQNVIERSVIVCETESFSVDQSWLSRESSAEPDSSSDLAHKIALQEKEIIEAALRDSGGRVFGPSGAAAKLRMPRSTLESKIRSLRIDKNRFKS
jgi:formate hydrogenlyase transcriptional activator